MLVCSCVEVTVICTALRLTRQPVIPESRWLIVPYRNLSLYFHRSNFFSILSIQPYGQKFQKFFMHVLGPLPYGNSWCIMKLLAETIQNQQEWQVKLTISLVLLLSYDLSLLSWLALLLISYWLAWRKHYWSWQFLAIYLTVCQKLCNRANLPVLSL